MLESPAPSDRSNVRLEGKHGDVAQGTRVARFDEGAVFEPRRDAVTQIAAQVQILEPMGGYTRPREVVELAEREVRGRERLHLSVESGLRSYADLELWVRWAVRYLAALNAEATRAITPRAVPTGADVNRDEVAVSDPFATRGVALSANDRETVGWA